jgi:hypothetical protein
VSKRHALVVGVAACLFAAGAQSQQPYVYPAKGQSAQQQQKDQGECYTWAKANTGIDPAAGVNVAAPQEQGGGAVGAVGGAAGGAIIAGAAGGNVGGAAAAGALIGGIVGHARQQRRNQEAQANAQAQVMQSFQRAYAACLEGRGYTVK